MRDSTRVTLYNRVLCDMCKEEDAKYDGLTTIGPWAYMCEECFYTFGVGIGTGKGQEIIYKKEGDR